MVRCIGTFAVFATFMKKNVYRMSVSDRRAVCNMLFNGALLASFPVLATDGETGPMLSEDDPEAQTLHYVTDVARAKNAKPGEKCATCSLYAGDRQSTSGPCPVFDNKLVSANGWCKSWMNM